jgi:shikimate dehydrogenase
MRSFGLIGFPLSHSFSATYFAKKFETEAIADAGYRLFPLKDISRILPLIQQQPDLMGINITIPHKIAIIPYLDKLTEEAKAVGAVNCIKIDRNASDIRLTGYNTDIFGFRESLLSVLKPNQQSALVLGTGGAAKAVCFTLQKLGIKYTMVSRLGHTETVLNYSQLTESIISNNLLIINTTPLGMFPETDNNPDIPYQFLDSRHLLYDLIYNPAETRFLKLGRKAGATTMNGLKMLELQAEKSWEIWNE